ncbi:MAG: pyruvate kinase [Bdellovibrionales bacterium]
MLSNRRAKVVATIGPASQDRSKLKELIEAGMNVARLNFSHGTHKDHLAVIKNIRELSHELRAPVCILQDLQGPKIRVGKFKDGEIFLEEGQKVVVTTRDVVGEPGLIPSDFKELIVDSKPGTRILLDDGLLELVVDSVDGMDLACNVVYGGVLKDRKGMNVPGANLSVDCLTEKDLKDLSFGLENQVDFVALSFVRSSKDMLKLKEIVQSKNPGTRIVAKIEMFEAIEDLVDIIKSSDGIMVARGDLAIEVGQARLAYLQKKIIRECNIHYKPVITATQMLDSMINNPRPTRAEVTDVSNAILDGTDALMLSAETASGKYPAKCIATMHEIALEIEEEAPRNLTKTDSDIDSVPKAIAASACLTAEKLEAKAIICLTTTGRTATYITSHRPNSRVIAITNVEQTLNRLELVWGIQTLKIDKYNTSDEAMRQVETLLLKYGVLNAGDKIVMSMGLPVGDRTKTNSIRVYTVESEGVRLIDSDLPLRFKS